MLWELLALCQGARPCSYNSNSSSILAIPVPTYLTPGSNHQLSDHPPYTLVTLAWHEASTADHLIIIQHIV